MAAKKAARKSRSRVSKGAQANRPVAVSTKPVQQLAQRGPAFRQVVVDTLGRLQTLGERVASSLGAGSDKRARAAASLVLIGTLALTTAACDEVPTDSGDDGSANQGDVDTAALQAEVASGLPTDTSKVYQVNPDTVYRDERGVYLFQWMDPATNQYQIAEVSKLRLAASNDNTAQLALSDSEGPVLNMPQDKPIQLIWPNDSAEGATPVPTPLPGTPTVTPTSGNPTYVYNHYYGGGYSGVPWFALGYLAGRSQGGIDPVYRTPAYRDPPSGSEIRTGQPLSGSTSSSTPKSFGERTVRSTTVSGMSRGTGSGSAVTGKSPSSSGVGAKSGTSSGGVKAPSSGGFSTGKSGGSSSSSS